MIGLLIFGIKVGLVILALLITKGVVTKLIATHPGLSVFLIIMTWVIAISVVTQEFRYRDTTPHMKSYNSEPIMNQSIYVPKDNIVIKNEPEINSNNIVEENRKSNAATKEAFNNL